MKHLVPLANKRTLTETAVDSVFSLERLNQMGIEFGPLPDHYQSLHRLVDELIWYVDCDGFTRYGHDYGHVPEQTRMGTGAMWALAIEAALALAIIAGLWIWRRLQ